MTSNSLPGGTFKLADDLMLIRMGYGAMQLAGPHVFGPPKDHDGAIAVLRGVVTLGINHIDTSDFYGPHITNQLIKEALHPYPEQLRIVTKVGARRDAEGNWPRALAPDELREAVEDNLTNLGLDALDVVNLRVGGLDSPTPGSIAEPFRVLSEMQRVGLIKHLGVSNVSAEQIAEAQSIAPVVCIQNFYNIANRRDDALIDSLAERGIGYVPVLPARWFYTVAIRNVIERRRSFKCQANEPRPGVAASTFAEHPAHSRNIISGTPERECCWRWPSITL